MTKISDETVRRALHTWFGTTRTGNDAELIADMRSTLEAVEAELCAQAPGPFVLSAREQHAMTCLHHPMPLPDGAGDALLEALKRAQRTLAPATQELTAEKRVRRLITLWRNKEADSCAVYGQPWQLAAEMLESALTGRYESTAKPAPVEAVDPVDALLAEMRTEDRPALHGTEREYWANRLEEALAARAKEQP
jgi:hypothetical protein